MNLDIIKKFIKLADKFVISCDTAGIYININHVGRYWEIVSILELQNGNILNLPLIVINLLKSSNPIHYKLALNLISKLDPNIKYR